MRSVVPIHPVADVVPLAKLSLHDVETVRALLRGSSVVDWFRLHFKLPEEIDAFIRVNELDPADPNDMARLRDLRKKAVDYLEQHLHYRVPDEIKQADDIRLLFRWASQTKGRRTHRLFACMTLKVMHIIHHAEGYELLFMLPLSHAELSVLLQAKIERVVRGLLERNFPLVQFAGNAKSPYSIFSKLLAKKDTQSAQIYDKLRFRLVAERREDIPPLLVALTRELVPFNYLMPGQTQNSLIDFDRMLVRAGNSLAIRNSGEAERDFNEAWGPDRGNPQKNEFSGPDYRVVSFVADVPIRVDRVLPIHDPRLRELGPVVYGAVEFQIIDRITAAKNETGENRHALYKARQRSKVKERLERGKRAKNPGPREDDAPAEEEEAPVPAPRVPPPRRSSTPR